MESSHAAQRHEAWNNGKLLDQKHPSSSKRSGQSVFAYRCRSGCESLHCSTLTSTASSAPAISCSFAYATYVTAIELQRERSSYSRRVSVRCSLRSRHKHAKRWGRGLSVPD